MTPWSIDITAPNRGDAIEQVRRAHLPFFACSYLVGLVVGENYTHTGRLNPDEPLRVWGSGNDHGGYIDIDTAGIEYTAAK